MQILSLSWHGTAATVAILIFLGKLAVLGSSFSLALSQTMTIQGDGKPGKGYEEETQK